MKTIDVADIVWAKVDRYSLDDECVKQTQLMVEYTIAAADARRTVDLFETEIKVLKANVDKDVRARPEKYHILKPTEVQIAATVATQTDVVEASRELADLQREQRVLDGLVTCLDARRRMIEQLSYLQGQGYFSEPRTGTAGKDAGGGTASRPATRPRPPKPS